MATNQINKKLNEKGKAYFEKWKQVSLIFYD